MLSICVTSTSAFTAKSTLAAVYSWEQNLARGVTQTDGTYQNWVYLGHQTYKVRSPNEIAELVNITAKTMVYGNIILR